MEEYDIIIKYIYLSKFIASKYRNKGMEYDDLVQEGNIGLMKAISHFDPMKNTLFSTYAYFWIRQSILDTLTSKSRTIRVPAHVVALRLKVYKFSEKFVISLGYEPDAALIAKELNVDKYLVDNVLNLNTEHTGDWEPIEESTIVEDCEQSDTVNHVLEAIKTLSPKEQLILGMKFGLLTSL